MDINDLAVDPDGYEDGRILNLGEGCYLRIRSTASKRAAKVRERLWRPYATFREEVPAETMDRLNADWITQGLLSEFVGFTDGGTPIEVHLALADDQKRLAELLRAPRFKALRNKIVQFALEDANYQAAGDEGVEGNSGTTPAGASGGAGRRKG